MGSLEERLVQMYANAEQMFDEREFHAAIPILEEIIEFLPRTEHKSNDVLRAMIYTNLATCHMNIKDYSVAEKIFEEAIKLNPMDITSFQNLIGTYKSQEKYEEALKTCAVAIEKHPYDAKLKAMYGETYNILMRNTEAIEQFELALRLDQNNLKAWSGMAAAHKNLSNNDIAETAANNALSIGQTVSLEYQENLLLVTQALKVLSTIALEKDEYDKMLKTCVQHISLDPGSEKPYVLIAHAHREFRKYPEALALIQTGLQKARTKDELYFFRALVSSDMKLQNDFDASVLPIKNNTLRDAAEGLDYLRKEKTLEGIASAVKSVSESFDLESVEYTWITDATNQETIAKCIEQYIIQNNGFVDLIQKLRETILQKENIKSASYIVSALVEYSGEEKKYVKMSQELFRDILKRSPDVLKSVSRKSKNVVEVISSSRVSQHMYMIKTCPENTPENREKIEREYKITRYIHSVAPGVTSEAVMLEQPFMMEKWILEPSLESFVHKAKEEEQIQEVKRCIDAMTEIHKVAVVDITNKTFEIKYYDDYEEKEYTLSLEKYDFANEIRRRLETRLGGDTGRIIQEYDILLKEIRLEEKFIHGDSFVGNWLKSGVAIDWEKACIGDPVHDLVELTNDITFQKIDKNIFLERYNDENQDINQLKKKYDIMCIHDSLCNVGTMAGRKKDIPSAQKYLNQLEVQVKPYPELHKEIVNYLRAVRVIA